MATNLVKKTIEDAASADDAGATLNEQFGVLMAAAADPKEGLVATGKMTQERYDAFVGELTKMRDAALKTVKGAVSPIAAAVNERDAINEIDAIKDENKTDVHRATRAELEVSLTKKLVKMMKDGKKVVVFDEFGRRWEVLSVEKGGMHVLGAGLARKKTAVIGYGAETHRPFSLTKERSDEAKAVLGAMSDAQKLNTDSMKQVVEMHGKGNIDAEHLGKALQYSRAGHVVDGREFTIGEVGALVAMKQKQEREWAESAAKLRRQRNSGKPTSEARRASLERKLDELERKVDYLREVLYGSGRKSLIPGLRRESLVDAYFAMLDSASSHRGTRKIYLSVMKAFGGKVSWGRVHRTYEAIRAKFATRPVFVDEQGRNFTDLDDKPLLISKTLKRAGELYDLIVGADEDALRVRDLDVPKDVRDAVEKMLRSNVTGKQLLPKGTVKDFVRLVAALRNLPASVEVDTDTGEIMLSSQMDAEQALTNYLVLMALSSQAKVMAAVDKLRIAQIEMDTDKDSDEQPKTEAEFVKELLEQYVANVREDDSASILNAAEPITNTPVLYAAGEYMNRMAREGSDAEVAEILGRFEAEGSLVRLLDPKRNGDAAGQRAELKRLSKAVMDLSHVQGLASVLIDINGKEEVKGAVKNADGTPKRAANAAQLRRLLSGSATAEKAFVDVLTLAEGMVDNPLYP